MSLMARSWMLSLFLRTRTRLLVVGNGGGEEVPPSLAARWACAMRPRHPHPWPGVEIALFAVPPSRENVTRGYLVGGKVP